MDTPPPEPDSNQHTPEALRRRITALEDELQSTLAAKEEAERTITKSHSARIHEHVARNLAAYGNSDEIIFVQPEDRDQGLLCRTARGKGATASACRVLVRYNVDQFFQRPVLHQWIQNGKLYREASEQLSSRFELFFDLLFVGMVHQISEAAAELPTGIGFARYVLTFAPAFSIWGDVRDIINQFSSDDVSQRAYILWIMMLLVGYANNASAIQWGKSEVEAELEGEAADTVDHDSFRAMQWTLGFFVIAKLSRVILSLFYSIFLPLSRRPLFVSSVNPLALAIIFFVAIFTPLHASITLVVVGIAMDHALRIVGVVLLKTMEVLGKKYEKKRQLASMSPSGEPVETPGTEKNLEEEENTTGVRTMNSSVTAVNEAAPLGDIKLCRREAKKSYRMPAINIEHHVERLGAFVTIVLGEMVMNVFFVSTRPVGLNAESGRALLGLFLAFNLNWIYFSQASKHFVHAIRRHWFLGFVFSFLHLPLCMALLLASSAVNRFVTSESIHREDEHGGGLKWYVGGGLGASICIMATVGFLHKNLDDQERLGQLEKAYGINRIRRTIGRKVVLSIRYAAGIAMILVPLVDDLNSTEFLAIYVGITTFLVIEETIARIERRDLALDKVEGSGDAA